MIVKKISMQTMDEPELGEAVRNEAAQYIPFDMSDVNIDYQVLSDNMDGPTIDVLLVAVKKDKISELHQCPAALRTAAGHC